MTNINLKGQHILVTGASDGIGKSVAEYLMRSGAKLAVHYNRNQKSAIELVQQFDNGSKAFQADLSVEKEVIKLFDDVASYFGRIDAIVLNAGVFISHSTNQNVDDWYKTWKKTISINLDAVGLLTKMGIDHFRNHKDGRFVYIGSRAVFRGETEEYLAYAASKGGLTSLARSVARSFGKENIKSFIVSPGFTRTQMAESFIEVYGEKRVLNEIALNNLTRPEDLAPLIALMCSGLMDHATGATIDVNAGSHIR
ncbi:SDR family oxidoreductase [Spongiivirga citrea]|uniref:SDR family oxidoreductase n=1 Tax=Spongiivirga citrea TaxID=1481457 RepID=A0A6M0CFQ3_9FLAO|nr:SDR family oxidoreductase [Spongiivirga citrea]NER16641.1 SDR family oxidoreductase [Spongiivirga citrea]